MDGAQFGLSDAKMKELIKEGTVDTITRYCKFIGLTTVSDPGGLTRTQKIKAPVTYKEGGCMVTLWDKIKFTKSCAQSISITENKSGGNVFKQSFFVNIPVPQRYHLKQAKERFRYAIKTILIMMKWILSLSEKSNESWDSDYGSGGEKTFTDIANEAFESGDTLSSGLSFDLSQFKAKKEVNISNEVKNILSTPSIARSPEQLQIGTVDTITRYCKFIGLTTVSDPGGLTRTQKIKAPVTYKEGGCMVTLWDKIKFTKSCAQSISITENKSGGNVFKQSFFVNIPVPQRYHLKQAKERFRYAIKTILIMMKWISSLSEKSNESWDSDYGSGGEKTFTDIANEAFESGDTLSSGLSFDLSQFKAKKEVNISNEVKNILSTPSIARSPEQLQIVLYGLQHLKSFAEYPLHMQEKLCKVAWFQQVPPKRVIIRQGHFAENFYFILSGQVVVRILDKNDTTGEVCLRTAAVMRKGTSFGELALLHRSRRTATVVSQDAVQLLTIGRDDFFDIFMSGQGPGQIPDHVGFVSTLDFMKDWPTDNLIYHPECCLFHFFKRGVVIVKDSSNSDWIYIVKSVSVLFRSSFQLVPVTFDRQGSCQVIKELKGVVHKARSNAEKEPKNFVGKNMLPRYVKHTEQNIAPSFKFKDS
ncbi:hypothetical protein CAPTEDRAFT_196325 [Capitella teleta]|uniref:Cyclic nucleotide-binding domain-containing protein n=1 Tax=Capitella teleta TaxID=283909 RepID=R7T4M4_CAPTE|nr:hypothetical protein CAPTEDRAFT_196325 [Capitella teleta]|eukprot:ELT87893.1 hypothetical protein CAPTEDRAFT_196325 [Capitella teleta]